MTQMWRWWFVGGGALMIAACTESIGPAAVKLGFTVVPSSATAGIAIGPVVAVAIQDASGNSVTRATNVVTVTIGTNPTGGTLAGTVSVSPVNGVATFSNLHVDKAGTGYTLTATATGLAGATSALFDITAGAATKLAFPVQPSNAMGGATITPPVQVAAWDSFGNLATEFGDSVTVSLGGNPSPGRGTLSGTTVVKAVAGVATFSDLSIASASAGYTLTASAGGLASVSSVPFAIATPPRSLHVSTTTTGASFDQDGYSVCVDPVPDPWDYGYSCTTSKAIGVNSEVTMPLGAGNHDIELDGLSANCNVGGTTTVEAGDTTEMSFRISCVAAGSVRVTTVTTGTDVPGGGYAACLDQSATSCSWLGWVPPNGTVTFPDLIAGPHTVTLFSVARNCTVRGATTRAVTVPQDGTGDVAFDANCIVVERIAYSYNGKIVVSGVDGSYSHEIAAGFAPAWSPNGARLAYECGQDICAINADSTGFARLTADAAGNHHPTWSPDGSKIAFAATHAGVTDLYVMTANGSGSARRTQGVGFVGSPAWSPDGATIAFDCRVDAGNDDLCSVNADGTGFARLTNDPARDYGAAWKPDGSTLAVATTRYGADEIVLMSANGGSVTRIGAGLPGLAPTWSLDGTRLAFVQVFQACGGWDYDCDSYYPYGVISTANADGSAIRNLTAGDQPAWKPHP